MKICTAIMQPYLFPYIGYFHLVDACDLFIFYDDVNYIKQGWVNRNKLLINDSEYMFTIPVKKQSSYSLIKDVELHDLGRFRTKFLMQITQSYKNAPYFKKGLAYVEEVLLCDVVSIAELSINSIVLFYNTWGENKRFVRSSEYFPETRTLAKEQRVVEILKRTSSSCYINAIGGQHIYDKVFFEKQGIKLGFTKSYFQPYNQVRQKSFIPGLSIIDVVMNNSKDSIQEQLHSYSIV